MVSRKLWCPTIRSPEISRTWSDHGSQPPPGAGNVDDLQFDRFGLQRDSTGWTAKAGSTFAFSRKLTGEFAVGYLERTLAAQGQMLLADGRPEKAIPVLERACHLVRASDPTTQDSDNDGIGCEP